MNFYVLPYLGNLDLTKGESQYSIDSIQLNDDSANISLNFENLHVHKEQMDKIKAFLENLNSINQQNYIHINKNYANLQGGTVEDYLIHHLSVMERSQLEQLIDFENTLVPQTEQLFNKIHLVRVALYLNDEDFYSIFDYTIGKMYTNYYIVIKTDSIGNLCYITMES